MHTTVTVYVDYESQSDEMNALLPNHSLSHGELYMLPNNMGNYCK